LLRAIYDWQGQGWIAVDEASLEGANVDVGGRLWAAPPRLQTQNNADIQLDTALWVSFGMPGETREIDGYSCLMLR
jgi:hypothetical protein